MVRENTIIETAPLVAERRRDTLRKKKQKQTNLALDFSHRNTKKRDKKESVLVVNNRGAFVS